MLTKADKALFKLKQKIKILNLEPKISFKLFDSVVLPVLLYGCEAWGDINTSKLEQFHTKFCKYLLNLRKSTTNNMIYSEFGRFPLEITIKTRCIKFWHKQITGIHPKLSTTLLNISQGLFVSGSLKSSWFSFIRNVLNECGIPFVFNHPTLFSSKYLECSVQQTLRDQFLQSWHNALSTSSSCSTYRIFKHDLSFAPYLHILPLSLSIPFCKFRLNNAKFPFVLKQQNRLASNECTLCTLEKLGDNFHFLFECTRFKMHRKRLLPQYYHVNPNTFKFDQLLNTTCKHILRNVAEFCRIIVNTLEKSY